MLGYTLIAKLCSDKTRATMYGLNGMIGSVGVVFINYFGGDLAEINAFLPNTIGYAIFLASVIATLVLGVTGKMKI